LPTRAVPNRPSSAGWRSCRKVAQSELVEDNKVENNKNESGVNKRMARERILIVEDDFLIAEGIRRILVDAGYEVVGMAAHTRTAEELAKEHPANLAIVSLKLEVDVDGVRTATYLQKRHDMKVLITTGFNNNVVQRSVGNPAPWPLLRKPFSETELLTAVSACLAEEGGDASGD
jgi:two-component system, response regulator PdtaR